MELGTSKSASSPKLAPTRVVFEIPGGQIAFEFTRPRNRFDVEFVVEASPDLTPGNWFPVAVASLVTDNFDGTETLRYENLFGLFPGINRVLIRLAVSYFP